MILSSDGLWLRQSVCQKYTPSTAQNSLPWLAVDHRMELNYTRYPETGWPIGWDKYLAIVQIYILLTFPYLPLPLLFFYGSFDLWHSVFPPFPLPGKSPEPYFFSPGFSVIQPIFYHLGLTSLVPASPSLAITDVRTHNITQEREREREMILYRSSGPVQSRQRLRTWNMADVMGLLVLLPLRAKPFRFNEH